MGGQGSGRKPDQLKQFTAQRANVASVGNEILELPNHSGIASHPELKKYVSDNAVTPAGSDGDLQINNSGVFGTIDGLNLDKTGNARGTNSLDIQSYRDADTQVAAGYNSLCLGSRNTSSGYSTTAIGAENEALIGSASAIGYANSASGYYGSAIGASNTGSGYYGSAIGWGNTASGYRCPTAIGYDNTASGYYYATAIGSSNTASGYYYATAIGAKNTASGYYSTIVGTNNAANTTETTVIGNNITNSTASSVEIGASDDTKVRMTAGNMYMLRDNAKIFYGAGNDASMCYDGTDMIIDTGLVSASDLIVDCGTDKTVELADTVFDDQQVNIGTAKLGASAPTWVAYKGCKVLSFAKGPATNTISFDMQMSHRLKHSTNIDFHIHTVVPDDNAGVIRWIFTYSFSDIFSDFPTETTVVVLQTIAAGSSAKHDIKQLVSNLGQTASVSGIALMSLERDGSHVDDTYNNDIYLIGADSHFEIDTQGSRQIYTK